MEIFREKLKLYQQEEVASDSYFCTVEYPMLCYNHPDSILSLQLRERDGITTLLYDITGCKSLKERIAERSFSEEDCRELLRSLMRLFDDLDEYLLLPDHVYIKEEQIYYTRDHKIKWMYCVEEKGEIGQQLSNLFSWILSKIDYEDQNAVEFIYHIHYALKKQNVTKEMLEECLNYRTKQRTAYDDFFQETKNRNRQEKQGKNQKAYEKKESWDAEAMSDRNEGVSRVNLKHKPKSKPTDAYDTKKQHMENEDSTPSKRQAEASKQPGRIYSIVQAILTVCVIGALTGAGYLSYVGLTKDEIDFVWRYIAGCGLLAVIFLLVIWSVQKKKRGEGKAEDAISSNFASSDVEYASWTSDWFDEEEATTLLEEKEQRKVWGKEQIPVPVLCNQETGEVLLLDELPAYIGSSRQCQIVIHDSTVSRKHAVISYQKEMGQFVLEDMDSKNGTWINGEQIQANLPVTVSFEDKIRFSRVEFLFEESI